MEPLKPLQDKAFRVGWYVGAAIATGILCGTCLSLGLALNEIIDVTIRMASGD